MTPDSTGTDRVRFRLDRWKRNLVDLTRRTALLNYRFGSRSRSKVPITGEIPQQVLRQLLEGASFSFDPKPEPNEDEKDGDSETEQQPGEPEQATFWLADTEGNVRRVGPGRETAEDDESGPSLKSGQELRVSYDPESLAEHHTDQRLQTPLTEQRLDKNLLHIHRRATSLVEEQGVNSLFLALGMLEWYEDVHSDEVNRAPLLLVPVMLERDSARAAFHLSIHEDEPALNPALRIRLKRDFDIELGELPEFSDEIEISRVFAGIREAVSGRDRWRLTSDIALGLFSFQKYLMYRDIERYDDKFRGHPVIQSLCAEGEDQVVGLPDEVAEADLEEEMAPWETVQVLDADSSQQRAMLAARKGHHLVIEGPPGTGKSQTIANLIADQMAMGKSVLFVSEKMAALEVVKDRLDGVGLGSFCLELHSRKARKTQVLGNIRKSLHLSVDEVDHTRELNRLENLVRELGAYVEELHRPYEPLGLSPFEGIEKLAEVEDTAPLVSARLPDVLGTDADAYEEAVTAVGELAAALGPVGDPLEHPLRGIRLHRASRTTKLELEDVASRAGQELSELTSQATSFAEEAAFEPPETLGDVELMVEAAGVMGASPGAERSVLENPRWNELGREVRELLERGERYAEIRDQIKATYRRDVFEVDESALRGPLRTFLNELSGGFWRFFKPAYWKARSALLAFTANGYQPDSAEALADEIQRVLQARDDMDWIKEHSSVGAELFGQRWNGLGSDWEELADFAEWVVELRQYALQEVLGERGLTAAAQGEMDGELLERRAHDLSQQVDDARGAVGALIETGEIDVEQSGGIGTDPATRLGPLCRRVDEVEANLEELHAWTGYRGALDRAADSVAGPFLHPALDAGMKPEQLVDGFQRLFFTEWVDAVCAERSELERFRGEQHEARIEEFRDLDARSKEMARDRAQLRIKERRNERLGDQEYRSQLQILQREARKKSHIMPLRKLLAKTPDVMTVIKPCFMMSPLSVAKYLDPDAWAFDVLVFDEASQIPPADAIGAVMRSEQVIVVGDSKQLPPTDFFSLSVEEDEPDDEDLLHLEDLESVLDEMAVSGVPSLRLKWHYRSEHESLIRFSNEEFYDEEPLLTFPSAVRKSDDLGLQFNYLEDVTYPGGGVNPEEARHVVRAVADHARNYAHLSLGVGTFGVAQQGQIQDEIERLRRRNPELEAFFQREGEDRFFVKNLENIQGDTRDVIYLSITYGPGPDGKVRRQFGPLINKGGWKRLNVLTTRARKVVRVFSSMRASQIDLEGISPNAALLRHYLEYAETGRYPTSSVDGGTPDSPFERAVIRALEREGYRTVPQVGDSGYRIDIGVLDPELPGRFVCGIECDGASYHSAQTARDRDRLRQHVLEQRGWDIHRVWSTDWFQDPSGQVSRLCRLIESSRERARSQPSPGLHPTSQKDGRSDVEPVGAELEEEAIEAPGLDDGDRPPIDDIPTTTYRVAELDRAGDSDEFYTVAIRQLARAAEKVLAIEGPIHRDLLARRVAGAWGIQRAGSQVKSRVDEAISHLGSRQEADIRGDFVWPPDLEKVPVRRRDGDGPTFPPDKIPPEEVSAAIRRLLAHRGPLLPDDIPSETARLLGYGRTGSRLKQRIEEGWHELLETGELKVDGLGITIDEG